MRIRAFTLIEILVCVAIVLVLAAIGGTVYIQAIGRGKLATEISQMHQIGLAANLYHEQYDAWPMSPTQLVDGGLTPKGLWLSPRDRYPRGLSNELLTDMGTGTPTDYLSYRSVFPNTYFGLGDFHKTREFVNKVVEKTSPGLFVSLLDSKLIADSGLRGNYEGIYRRVLLDTSVVIRHHQEYTRAGADGKPEKFSYKVTWFFDPDKEWIQKESSTF